MAVGQVQQQERLVHRHRRRGDGYGYTPTDAVGKSDINYYLRATASYTDPEGSGKTAVMNSEYTVQANRSSNNAPKFADDQDLVMDDVQGIAARKVAENTAPGTDIGAPVAATDADNDILTYTLSGVGVGRIRHRLGHGPVEDQGAPGLRGDSHLHPHSDGHGPVRRAREGER